MGARYRRDRRGLDPQTDSGRWVRTDPWDTGPSICAAIGACSAKPKDAPGRPVVERNRGLRAGITHVVIDPSAAYAAAVTRSVAQRRAGRRPLSSGQARQRRADRGPAPVTFDTLGQRGRKQDGMGQPPPVADRARTPGAQGAFAAMERPDRQRSERSDLSAYIAKRNCASCSPPPATASMTPDPHPALPVLQLVPTPKSPNCTAWPPRSRPGGRRSNVPCTPG